MIALALLAAVTAPATYRALGTEPFWSLTIERGRMRLEEPGRREAVVAAPRAQRMRGGWRWRSRLVTVTTRRGACSDGMSDRVFAEHVTVRWKGRVLTGCGGGVVAGEG